MIRIVPCKRCGQKEVILLFQRFVDNFSKYFLTGPDTVIFYYSCDNGESPFEITKNILFVNLSMCNSLGLSESEMFAFIAHEIGHNLDQTTKICGDLTREYNADLFALQLGLKDSLISGLQKLIDSDNFKDANGIMISRIKRLQNNIK